jgi:hypothetical protein
VGTDIAAAGTFRLTEAAVISLKMEATRCPEMLITWHHNSEYHKLKFHRREISLLPLIHVFLTVI